MKQRFPSVRAAALLMPLYFILLVTNSYAQLTKWEPTFGPEGGLFSKVSILDNGVMFASGSSDNFDGGMRVFYSRDTAKSWSQLNGVFNGTRPKAYCRMGKLIFAEDWQGSIFMTNDKGLTWSKRRGQSFTTIFQSLFGRGDTLYGFVYGAWVFRSIDSAKTWQSLPNGMPTYLVYDTIYHRFDTLPRPLVCFTVARSLLLVATDTGVYRSTNSGISWIRASEGLSDTIVNAFATVGDTVLALTKSAIYRSIDRAVHWSVSLVSQTQLIAGSDLIASAWLKDNSYWVTTDAGEHWVKRNDSTATGPLVSIGFVGTLNFIGTAGQGILRSNDTGKTWKESNHHLNDITTTNLMFDGHTILASAMQSGVSRSSDGGKTWSQVCSLPYNEGINCFFKGMGHVYFAYSGDLYRSSDDGVTWRADGKWDGPTHERIQGIGSIHGELLAGAEMGWFVSLDSGDSWKLRARNCGVGGEVQYTFFSSDTIWEQTTCALDMSTDNANNWQGVYTIGWSALNPQKENQNQHFNGYFGRDIWFGPENRELTKNLHDDVDNILVTSTRIFAATKHGLFETTDYGLSWKPDSEGIGAVRVYDVINDFDTLYCSTDAGVYRSVYNNLMAVTSYPSFFSIKGFGLYPNPSINKVQIYYSLTKRSELKINILNILGQEKIDVFTGTEEPGEYSKSIDSENLPSGTYFVKLVANGVASIKSLQIMH